jgi:hypothetical protein
MRYLLMAPLLAALVATPYAGAQHAASAGHSGGFSAPHSVAPAPQMSGGFGAGSHFASPTMAPRSFNAPPQYHWSVPARALGTPQNSVSYGNGHTLRMGIIHRTRRRILDNLTGPSSLPAPHFWCQER